MLRIKHGTDHTRASLHWKRSKLRYPGISLYDNGALVIGTHSRRNDGLIRTHRSFTLLSKRSSPSQ